jgi:aryl-alcohol dehydrogenase-like predicted oxidoreductase
MNKRPLGSSGIDIAPLVFGGNVFGWTVDEATSFALLDRCAAAGLNAIDTADVYSAWAPGNEGGESETIIGKWMKREPGRRADTIVITKVGSAFGPYAKGLPPGRILAAVEDSLRRLQTDYIDVYLSHWPDPETPIDETLRAYETLLAQGKVRAIGCSNYSAVQLQEALTTARDRGLPPYTVVQPEYNLYDRDRYEGDLRNLCMQNGMGVITYFSLASGFLSGKYRSDADFGKSPRGAGMSKYLNERGLRILAALDSVAAEHSASPAEVALAWLIAREGVTAPIASATTVEQVDSLVRSTQLEMSADQLRLLDEASAPA